MDLMFPHTANVLHKRTTGITCPPVDLHWFFEISIRTEKKIQLELKKKISYKLTEIFFQCSLIFFFQL